ncbi:MAG: hypothetical protein SFU86_17730 [Pirellulaceae bacterium]|nr:hypothetical protein [Pirellulaceae bacterium]
MTTRNLTESVSSPRELRLSLVEPLFERIYQLIRDHAALAREASDCVRQLKVKCEEQFGAEENSPLIAAACSQAPWLERQINDLKRQHDALRRRLVSLGRSLEYHQPLPRSWEEFAEELSFFERQLSMHETVEVDFWQDISYQEIGTKD